MKSFLINDLIAVNSASTGIYTNGTIEGLELVGGRFSQGNYAGRAGGWVGPQREKMRLVTLTGVVTSMNGTQQAERRRALIAALESRSVVLRMTDYDDSKFVVYGVLDEGGLIMARNPLNPQVSEFTLHILCPDPVIYDDSNADPFSVIIQRKASGGFDIPVLFPVLFEAGSQPTVVNNSGSVGMRPQVILRGVGTNPKIMNVTSGRFIQLEGFSMVEADIVTIDMRLNHIDLNGGAINNRVSADSKFWSLLKGDNAILLDSGSGSDTVYAEITWRPGSLGR